MLGPHYTTPKFTENGTAVLIAFPIGVCKTRLAAALGHIAIHHGTAQSPATPTT
jgi:hypothetical protein